MYRNLISGIIAIMILLHPLFLYGNGGNVAVNISDIYAWITQVSIGPIEADKNGETNHYYRLVITTVEIYQHLYLEFIKTDAEAFDRKVMQHHELPFDKFNCNWETSQISVEKWLGYAEVQIRVGEKAFLLHLNENLARSSLEELTGK
jgi:hypothetical protein